MMCVHVYNAQHIYMHSPSVWNIAMCLEHDQQWPDLTSEDWTTNSMKRSMYYASLWSNLISKVSPLNSVQAIKSRKKCPYNLQTQISVQFLSLPSPALL